MLDALRGGSLEDEAPDGEMWDTGTDRPGDEPTFRDEPNGMHEGKHDKNNDNHQDDVPSETLSDPVPDSLRLQPERTLRSSTPSPVSLFTPLVTALANPSLFPTLYSLCLIGSSVGFYLFVYFTTLGYALGIGLPAVWLVILSLRNRHCQGLPWHTILVGIWSLRLAAFHWHREFHAWPALHDQYQQVRQQRRQQSRPSLPSDESLDLDTAPSHESTPIPPSSTGAYSTPSRSTNISTLGPPPLTLQILCWMVYSFAYTCLVSPCHRLWRQSQTSSRQYTHRLALLLQIAGLTLETVADWTKSEFKRARPGEWCHLGVWKYGRHVNYVGEWVFWCGLWLAGVSCERWNVGWMLVMTTGLVFVSTVLYAAADFLGARQLEKYGHDPEYLEFRGKYGALGPNMSTMAQFLELQWDQSRQRWNAWIRSHQTKVVTTEPSEPYDQGSVDAASSLLL